VLKALSHSARCSCPNAIHVGASWGRRAHTHTHTHTHTKDRDRDTDTNRDIDTGTDTETARWGRRAHTHHRHTTDRDRDTNRDTNTGTDTDHRQFTPHPQRRRNRHRHVEIHPPTQPPTTTLHTPRAPNCAGRSGSASRPRWSPFPPCLLAVNARAHTHTHT